jgi:hypothetical protein
MAIYCIEEENTKRVCFTCRSFFSLTRRYHPWSLHAITNYHTPKKCYPPPEQLSRPSMDISDRPNAGNLWDSGRPWQGAISARCTSHTGRQLVTFSDQSTMIPMRFHGGGNFSTWWGPFYILKTRDRGSSKYIGATVPCWLAGESITIACSVSILCSLGYLYPARCDLLWQYWEFFCPKTTVRNTASPKHC